MLLILLFLSFFSNSVFSNNIEKLNSKERDEKIAKIKERIYKRESRIKEIRKKSKKIRGQRDAARKRLNNYSFRRLNIIYSDKIVNLSPALREKEEEINNLSGIQKTIARRDPTYLALKHRLENARFERDVTLPNLNNLIAPKRRRLDDKNTKISQLGQRIINQVERRNNKRRKLRNIQNR